MADAVVYRREDAVGIITLNRPDNRNSMTPELLAAFAAASAQARADRDMRCLVITGTGRCFSAGADFNATLQLEGERPKLPHEKSYAMYEAFLSILDIEVPVIGALNGHTVGGGLGLSLMCDVRIGNRASKYGANFCKLGLSPGMAISFLLPRLVGVSRAAELMFTGRLVEGDEAERIGLLSRALAEDEVLPAALETARAIAGNAPVAVRLTKQVMYENLGWDVRGAALREAFSQAATVDTADAAEGIAALLGKRAPVFRGV